MEIDFIIFLALLAWEVLKLLARIENRRMVFGRLRQNPNGRGTCGSKGNPRVPILNPLLPWDLVSGARLLAILTRGTWTVLKFDNDERIRMHYYQNGAITVMSAREWRKKEQIWTKEPRKEGRIKWVIQFGILPMTQEEVEKEGRRALKDGELREFEAEVEEDGTRYKYFLVGQTGDRMFKVERLEKDAADFPDDAPCPWGDRVAWELRFRAEMAALRLKHMSILVQTSISNFLTAAPSVNLVVIPSIASTVALAINPSVDPSVGPSVSPSVNPVNPSIDSSANATIDAPSAAVLAAVLPQTTKSIPDKMTAPPSRSPPLRTGRSTPAKASAPPAPVVQRSVTDFFSRPSTSLPAPPVPAPMPTPAQIPTTAPTPAPLRRSIRVKLSKLTPPTMSVKAARMKDAPERRRNNKSKGVEKPKRVTKPRNINVPPQFTFADAWISDEQRTTTFNEIGPWTLSEIAARARLNLFIPMGLFTDELVDRFIARKNRFQDMWEQERLKLFQRWKFQIEEGEQYWKKKIARGEYEMVPKEGTGFIGNLYDDVYQTKVYRETWVWQQYRWGADWVAKYEYRVGDKVKAKLYTTNEIVGNSPPSQGSPWQKKAYTVQDRHVFKLGPTTDMIGPFDVQKYAKYQRLGHRGRKKKRINKRAGEVLVNCSSDSMLRPASWVHGQEILWKDLEERSPSQKRSGKKRKMG
ncbi:hypothetical protein HK097_009159 [Rhizophlyctis rosea]|uniref:Uncharacterized protein n=1 Tax=Rhizophlyctis rosea TaxID=64517 RepID=A0AAD5SC24_9FUNG|nr:hypothetical protein HK097_009159 [Rhizophlyctis rosea]